MIMRKLLYAFFVMLLAPLFLSAQVIYQSNFDDLTAGGFLADQDANWTTWSGLPGSAEDAPISADEANTVPNSAMVTGGTDLIYLFGDQTSGVYQIGFNMMVAEGYGGYFNIESEALTTWAFDVYFATDGTGFLAVGDDDIDFTYANGAWVPINMVINLDADWAELFIGHQYVYAWQYSLGDPANLQLGCIDLFATAPDGDPLFYFDDFKFMEGAGDYILLDNLDSYNDGDYVASTLEDFTTWSGAPGTDEDATFTTAQASSAPISFVETGTTDMVWLLGNQTAGKYKVAFDMYVPSGNGAYFNIMYDFTGTQNWAWDVYFNSDGTGNFSFVDDYEFTPVFDTWFPVEMYINLDTDGANVFINNELIYSGAYSTNVGDGELMVGAVDFWAHDDAGGNPLGYFDNLEYSYGYVEAFADDFDAYTAGNYLAASNAQWTTWSVAPGTAEDATISNAYAESGTNSFLVEGTTDLIFPFGDLESGVYEINVDVYVPTGFGGYFNIMNDFTGQSWAFDIHFQSDGAGLLAADEDVAFDFDFDAWNEVYIYIDLDNDYAAFEVNGTWVHEWTYSNGGPVMLSVADFFAHDNAGGTPQAYFDNFEFNIIGAGGVVPPAVVTDMANIEETVFEGDTYETTFNIMNDGGEDLEYEIVVTYPAAKDPVTLAKADLDAAQTVYSWGTDYSYWVGAVYSPEDLEAAGVIGLEITDVVAYIDTFPLEGPEVRIYETMTANNPGVENLVYSQAFTPTIASFNQVVLDESYLITGKYLWIGVWIHQPAGTGVMATDGADPAVDGGNMQWFDAFGWYVSTDLGVAGNWMVGATCDGTPLTPWVTVDPAMGVLVADEDVDVSVTLDATGLAAGTYNAVLNMTTNDEANLMVTADIAFTVEAYAPVTFVVDDQSQTYTAMYLKGSWNTAGEFDASWNGGDEHTIMYDDGTNGDATAGDHMWSVTVMLVPDGGTNSWEWGVNDQDHIWIDGNWGFTVADATAQTLTEIVGSVDALDFEAVNVYPNPVNDMLYIENVDGLETITILDVVGKEIATFTQPEGNLSFETTRLEAGVYIVQMVDFEGNIKNIKITRE